MLDPDRHKQTTASNRENGKLLLEQAGLSFTAHNKGAHLVVAERIDYWPGTGLWIVRQTGKRGRGIFPLLKHLRG